MSVHPITWSTLVVGSSVLSLYRLIGLKPKRVTSINWCLTENTLSSVCKNSCVSVNIGLNDGGSCLVRTASRDNNNMASPHVIGSLGQQWVHRNNSITRSCSLVLNCTCLNTKDYILFCTKENAFWMLSLKVLTQMKRWRSWYQWRDVFTIYAMPLYRCRLNVNAYKVLGIQVLGEITKLFTYCMFSAKFGHFLVLPLVV